MLPFMQAMRCPPQSPHALGDHRKRQGRRPPLEAVSFVQQLAGNRLTEVEAMFLPEFNHAPNGFHSRLLLGGGIPCRLGGALNEGEEELFQGHATGLCLRQEPCFNFRLELQSNRHCFLSPFTICQPRGCRKPRMAG